MKEQTIRERIDAAHDRVAAELRALGFIPDVERNALVRPSDGLEVRVGFDIDGDLYLLSVEGAPEPIFALLRAQKASA